MAKKTCPVTREARGRGIPPLTVATEEYFIDLSMTSSHRKGHIQPIFVDQCVEWNGKSIRPLGGAKCKKKQPAMIFGWDEVKGYARAPSFTPEFKDRMRSAGRAHVLELLEKRLREHLCGSAKKKPKSREGMVYNPYTDRWSWF